MQRLDTPAGADAPTQSAPTPTANTLPIRLTREQRAVLELLAARQKKSLNAIVLAALSPYAQQLGLEWPAPVDGRARKTPRPTPPIIKLPRRTPQEHLEWLIKRLVNYNKETEPMTLEGWSELRAVYRALRASMGEDIARCWTLLDQHDGDMPALRRLLGSGEEYRLCAVLYSYEAVRAEWSPQWDRVYGRGPKRSELTPAQLERLRAGDRRRKTAQRRRDAAARKTERDARLAEFEEGHVTGPDDDIDKGDIDER